VKQIGLQIREEIDVPAGGLYLRTGIYDVGSNKAGTLGIPLDCHYSAEVGISTLRSGRLQAFGH